MTITLNGTNQSFVTVASPSEVSVEVFAPPTVAIIGSDSICAGTTTQLVPVAGGTWISNDSSVATVTDSGLVTGCSTGNVTFTYTDTATGCSATTATVRVDTFPVVEPVTAAKDIICVGEKLSLFCRRHTGGGDDGTWMLSNNNAVIISSTPTEVTVNGIAHGRVFVTYTAGTGVCQTKSTFLLKVILPIPPEIIIGIER
jgi:hypothetical protein